MTVGEWQQERQRLEYEYFILYRSRVYNPSNLASMIKGMKNKNQTREDKIKARMEYQKQSVN